MSVHIVRILMHCPGTHSQRWHSRRFNKMVRSVWLCFAYADPGQTVNVDVFCHLDSLNIPGINTYTVELTIQLPNDKMQAFIRYAKNVKMFHSVSHTHSVPSDTIPA